MYQAVLSIAEIAAKARDAGPNTLAKESMLSAFLKIKKYDLNFGRTENFAILKVSQSSEEYIGLHDAKRGQH
jgi:hypothetical protein